MGEAREAPSHAEHPLVWPQVHVLATPWGVQRAPFSSRSLWTQGHAKQPDTAHPCSKVVVCHLLHEEMPVTLRESHELSPKPSTVDKMTVHGQDGQAQTGQ